MSPYLCTLRPALSRDMHAFRASEATLAEKEGLSEPESDVSGIGL